MTLLDGDKTLNISTINVKHWLGLANLTVMFQLQKLLPKEIKLYALTVIFDGRFIFTNKIVLK